MGWSCGGGWVIWGSGKFEGEEGVEAALVFGARSDGDADPLGELVAVHGAGDDTLFLEFEEDPPALAHFDEEEIGEGGDEIDASAPQGVFEEMQTLKIVQPGVLEVGGVFDGREGAGLGNGVDVERLADPFEGLDQVRVTDAVAEAEAGQTVNLGERAQENEVFARSGADKREEINSK